MDILFSQNKNRDVIKKKSKSSILTQGGEEGNYMVVEDNNKHCTKKDKEQNDYYVFAVKMRLIQFSFVIVYYFCLFCYLPVIVSGNLLNCQRMEFQLI